MSAFLARRWRQQPQGVLTVDLGHPLAAGLAVALTPRAFNIFDSNQTPITPVSVRNGPVLAYTKQSDAVPTIFTLPKAISSSNWTLLQEVSCTPDPANFSATGGIHSSASERIHLHFKAYPSGNFGADARPYITDWNTTSGLPTSGRVILGATISSPATTISGYVNGSPTVFRTDITPSTINVNQVELFRKIYGGGGPDSMANGSTSSFFFVWTRPLSSSEMYAVSENPWQIFNPRQTVFYSLPADLYSALDETTSDQSDYIKTLSRGSVYTATFAPIAKPASGTNIAVNFDAASPTDTGSINFELLSGSTVIKSQSVPLAKNVGFYLPRRWRRQQPQGAVQVDWNNPLTRLIDNCILITGNGIFNPVNPLLTPSIALTTVGSPLGVGTEPITDPRGTVSLSSVSNKDWTRASFFAYGFVSSKIPYPGNNAPQIFGARSFSAAKTNYDYSGENVLFGFVTSNFEYPGLETVPAGYASVLRPGFSVSLGAVFSTGYRQCAFYANGKYLGYQQGGTWDTISAPMRNPGDGTGMFMNSYTGNVLSFCASWSRVLSASEFAAMDENPWQIFKPQERRIVSVPRTVDTSFTINPDEYAAIDTPKFGRFLPQRWKQQPQGAVEVNWANPITRLLSTLASPTNQLIPFVRPNPTAPKFIDSIGGLGGSIFRSGKFGLGVTDANSVGNYVFTGTYSVVGGDSSLTVVHAGEMVGPNDGSLVGSMGASWGSGNLYVYRTATDLQVKSLILGTSVNPSITQSILGTPIRDSIIVQTGVFTDANPISVSVGKSFFSSNQNWTASFSNNYVNNANFVSSGPFIQFYTAIWTRKLSTDERLSLNENPWQIFRPNPGRLYGLPPAGGWPWTPIMKVTSS